MIAEHWVSGNHEPFVVMATARACRLLLCIYKFSFISTLYALIALTFFKQYSPLSANWIIAGASIFTLRPTHDRSAQSHN